MEAYKSPTWHQTNFLLVLVVLAWILWRLFIYTFIHIYTHFYFCFVYFSRNFFLFLIFLLLLYESEVETSILSYHSGVKQRTREHDFFKLNEWHTKMCVVGVWKKACSVSRKQHEKFSKQKGKGMNVKACVYE